MATAHQDKNMIERRGRRCFQASILDPPQKGQCHRQLIGDPCSTTLINTIFGSMTRQNCACLREADRAYPSPSNRRPSIVDCSSIQADRASWEPSVRFLLLNLDSDRARRDLIKRTSRRV